MPLLVHNGVQIRQSCAIALYLIDLFPKPVLGFGAQDARRGEYPSWLFSHAEIIESVIKTALRGVDHPMWLGQTRGMAGIALRLSQALAKGPWLMGDRSTAADILCHSVFAWAELLMTDDPAVRDWVARCQARPAMPATLAFYRAQRG